MSRGRPSAAQSAAARKNGARSKGRPKNGLVLPVEKAAAAPTSIDPVALLRRERAHNFQFLIDLRNGLLPGYTLADRLRAVESMLDRDIETARVRGELPPMPEHNAPKLFEIGESGEFAPPDGWTDTPLVEAEPNGNGHAEVPTE